MRFTVTSVILAFALTWVALSRADPPSECNCCLPNPVADIQSFRAWQNPQDDEQVKLKFKIQPDHPNEYAAVYVSDNPLGPANLIDLLTDHAVLLPDSTVWTDVYRLPPADSYYYWLDYDVGPFAPRRAPQGLFPATGNPVAVDGSTFIGFSPPWITSIVDVPFDQGGSVTVNWSAPNGWEDADAFNIYRHSYPAGEPGYDEWRVVGWVSTLGPLAYVDESAPTGWVNNYKVSIAHHGNFELDVQPGHGNTGIWNSFSPVVAGTSIDNFAIDQITLLSNDTLRVCPAGDGATPDGSPDAALRVEVIIWGSNISPTVGIPPEMLECYVMADSVFTCAGQCDPHSACLDTLIVDGPTDSTGRTTLTASHIGGHGRADLIFGLADSYTRFDTLTVYIKSPDENGDGSVNVLDFGSLTGFVSTYQSPPHTYKWYRDFSSVAPPYHAQTVADFGVFGTHYNHVCGGGSQIRATTADLTGTTVRVELEEKVSATVARRLEAEVSIINTEPFGTAYIALRSDHPDLKYLHWDAGSYPGRVLVTPVVRDGVPEIAIGVLDGETFQGRNLSLGRLVYDVTTEGNLEFRTRDFETRAADMALATGDVGMMGSSATAGVPAVERVVEDALAQNHPNPFNPTTTISYSIARSGKVSLAIFSVSGALVRKLVDDDQVPNRYRVEWDGADNAGSRVASGVYFYQLKTAQFTATRKMVLLK